jgi:hypothetical protein
MLVTKVSELKTPPHIGVTPRKDVDNLVNISQCENKLFQRNRQNSALIAVLIQLRHNSMVSDGKQLLTTGSRYVPGMSIASRQKIGGGNRNYDRLALFADTREPGRCFAVIFKNPTMSTKFFKRCERTHEGVGYAFFLDEPTPVTNTLGSTSSVPILEEVLDCLPLSNSIKTLVPAVPLIPPEMGCTRYFASHNVTMEIPNSSFVESLCNGIFCDRQLCVDSMTNPKTAKCGCFHYDRSTAPITIQFGIVLQCPLDFDQTGAIDVSSYRSYRTTLLFIKKENLKYVKKNSYHHLHLLRKAVKDIFTYVNNNGGWSYIGWLRTGTVQDVSDTQSHVAENIASTSQMPHLSYLYPTNELIINDNNEEFQKLQMIPSEENLNENNIAPPVNNDLD